MTRIALTAAILSALLLSACGSDVGEDTTTSTGADGTTTTTSTTSTTTSVSSTTATTSSTTSTSTTLPGERIEFGPRAGDIVAVIGVAHDDVLNLRAAPGPDHEIVGTIPPTFAELTAEGNTRDIGDAFWIEVTYEGRTGWVHMGFIGFIGVTEDETAGVVDQFGEVPSAGTMSDLGLVVAESMASEEPESDIVMTVRPTVNGLGEVTYDVIGLGDDAVRGLRVHVFGEPRDEGFALDTVEVTALCGRGITEDRLCT